MLKGKQTRVFHSSCFRRLDGLRRIIDRDDAKAFGLQMQRHTSRSAANVESRATSRKADRTPLNRRPLLDVGEVGGVAQRRADKPVVSFDDLEGGAAAPQERPHLVAERVATQRNSFH